VSLVDQLNSIGYELLHLSDNTGERVVNFDAKYSFLQKFNYGIFSHIVKHKKPGPLVYQLLLAKASHPAAACVYIDDKPVYLEPAKKLGMQVIAFNNFLNLKTGLERWHFYRMNHNRFKSETCIAD